MEAERRTKPAGDNCDEVARDHEARLQHISPPQLDSMSQEVGPAKLVSADRVTIFSVLPGDQPAGGAAVPQGRGRREALPHTGVPAQTVRQEDPLQHERFREGGTESYR